MPTSVWLLAGAGSWLAGVCATCLLLTLAKRADARLQTVSRQFVERAAGGLPVDDASGLLAPPRSAIALGACEPPPGARPITTAAGEYLDPPQSPPLPSADVNASSAADVYWLYLDEEPVAQLHWLAGRGGAFGWYLWRRSGDWHRLTVDRDLDAGFGPPAAHPDWHETADLAAAVTTALALDAAAKLLNGPSTPPLRPLHAGHYELHASRLPARVVPIAFPEAIIVCAGDVSVLAGHFDDLALTILTRRIALLGGRLLAIFHADPTHVEGQPR